MQITKLSVVEISASFRQFCFGEGAVQNLKNSLLVVISWDFIQESSRKNSLRGTTGRKYLKY